MASHGIVKPNSFTGIFASLMILVCLSITYCQSCAHSGHPPRCRVDISAQNIDRLMNATVAFVEPREPTQSTLNPLTDIQWRGPICSGFFVDRTHLVSAAHCFQHMRTFELVPGITVRTLQSPMNSSVFFVERGGVEWVGGNVLTTPIPAEVTLWDAENDVVILRVTQIGFMPRSWVPLSETLPARGDEIFHVGHPLTISWSFFTGYVSSLIRTDSDDPVMDNILQVNMAISPGCSGGPVVDSNGEIIGLVNSFMGPGTNVGLCRTAPVIRRLIDSED